MLIDRDRAKVCKNAKKHEQESGINEVATVGVAKFGTSQFSQRWGELAPGVGIGNWVERKLKALPDCPGKDQRKRSPITSPPKRICPRAMRFIACDLRHHFQGSDQCLK